jgi:VPDSG-CTERM motif
VWNFAFNDTQNNDAFNLSGSATGPWIPFFGTDVAFQINGTTVPDTGSTITLLGFASLGLVALRRKLRC